MISADMMREQLGLAADDGGMDSLIETLITQAEAYVRAYCRLRPWEDIPDFLVIQMVAEDYGRLGGAGISSRTISGAAEYYRGDYSPGVLAALRGLRHPAALRRWDGC